MWRQHTSVRAFRTMPRCLCLCAWQKRITRRCRLLLESILIPLEVQRCGFTHGHTKVITAAKLKALFAKDSVVLLRKAMAEMPTANCGCCWPHANWDNIFVAQSLLHVASNAPVPKKFFFFLSFTWCLVCES